MSSENHLSGQDIAKAEREGRVMIFYIHVHEIFLSFWPTGPGLLRTIEILPDTLPENVVWRNAFFDPGRDALGFVLVHPSFDPTIPGGQFRVIDRTVAETKVYELQEDGNYAPAGECPRVPAPQHLEAVEAISDLLRGIEICGLLNQTLYELSPTLLANVMQCRRILGQYREKAKWQPQKGD